MLFGGTSRARKILCLRKFILFIVGAWLGPAHKFKFMIVGRQRQGESFIYMKVTFRSLYYSIHESTREILRVILMILKYLFRMKKIEKWVKSLFSISTSTMSRKTFRIKLQLKLRQNNVFQVLLAFFTLCSFVFLVCQSIAPN